ncbi:alpha/beta hydrolase-fold protein [Microbacterium sp. ZW T5_56]|uniref:alpha/beta hydrolase-fold protein n=1 Tax=Microbacterium sp. ZW T5_56 TaxID=3378081 RepID=UPI00385408DF
MRTWLLTVELIDSPVRMIVGLVVLGLVIVVLLRGRRPVRHLIGALVGAAALAVGVLSAQSANAFSGELPAGTAPWVVVTGALVGVGVIALVTGGWWRRVAAAALVITSALSLGLAVNALYGVTHTPAAVFGIDVGPAAELPPVRAGEQRPTIAEWKPPADLPAQGRTGVLRGDERIIPSRTYAPRDASVYLPPAALVKDAPELPVIVMMMGQPGSPDVTPIAAAADAYAAGHQGLAPIIVVVDQLAGSPDNDPVCTDSATYGAVATYINVDVPAYIRSHFAVLSDSAAWTIAGYSNGGACAFAFGAQHPKTWGTIGDVSGNEYPGSENPKNAVTLAWAGDEAAYQASLPAAVLAAAKPGTYTGNHAIFTHGDQDTVFGPGQVKNAALAQQAGFQVSTMTIPGEGHVRGALSQGLAYMMATIGTDAGFDAHTTTGG